MLYGKDAAAMYDQAAALQKSARETFYKASDAFFKANAAASYNDWKRARAHWDYVSPPCRSARRRPRVRAAAVAGCMLEFVLHSCGFHHNGCNCHTVPPCVQFYDRTP